MDVYQHQEYPKAVYGPTGDCITIESEDERPEGYLDDPNGFVTAAVTEARASRAQADKAAKDLRKSYTDMLDLHKVVYDPALKTDQLAELVTSLEAHLAAQAGNDAGQ